MRRPSRTLFPVASCLVQFGLVLSLAFSVPCVPAGSARRPVTVVADVGATVRLPGALLDSQPAATRLCGDERLVEPIAAGRARTTVLAAADFDEDGHADLVCGYDIDSMGAVALILGRGHGNSTARGHQRPPFEPVATVSATPVVPDWFAAADFDADGHADLAMASADATSLVVLRGTGRGTFVDARTLRVGGRITTLASGDFGRRDGLADLIVCVDGEHNPRALVYAGRHGAVSAEPESVALPGAATAAETCRLGRDADAVAALIVNGSLFALRRTDGRIALDALAAGRSFVAIVSGRFRSHCNELAALTLDGELVIARADGSAAAVGRIPSHPSASARLVATRLGGESHDCVAALDRDARTLTIVSGDASASRLFEFEGEVGAALPLRIDGDGLPDLVVVGPASSVPQVLIARGGPLVTVTNTDDDGPGSLRQAIFAAGANLGGTIVFAIPGSGPFTIAVRRPLPDLLDPVTIDATTQPGYTGAPIVEIDNTSAPNGAGLKIGTANVVIRGLSITNADGSAVAMFEGDGSFVEGCYLGLDPDGAPGPNGQDGVSVDFSANVTVGGTSASARNVVSGNASCGVRVGTGSSDVRVVGNYIGLDPTGRVAVANVGDGVDVSEAVATTVGGPTASERNVISGNGALGVGIFDSDAAGTVVQGNRIGTDADGTAPVGNAADGVLIQQAPDSTVGGTSAGAGNLISANGLNGVAVIGSGATSAVIQGNAIGTNAAAGAPLANSGNGVYVSGAIGTLVGGPDGGNVISGNSALGVGIFDGSANIRVQANRIGLGGGDVPLGNSYDGIYVQDSSDNLVGGSAPGDGNTVAFNGASGILVLSGQRNTISRNSFFSNAWIGIDVDAPGISINDDGDADTGANGVLNYPVLKEIAAAPGGTTVSGRYDGAPGRSFRLEFFSSEDCDPFGFGEGQAFVGAIDVTTDSTGSVQFVAPIASAGTVLTATATDHDGNTSEFSECARAQLAWQPPTADGGPPRNLTIAPAAGLVAPASPTRPRADLTAYKVYRSTVSPVPTTPGNLFTSVPPSTTTVMVPSSTGGFFTVTACYSDGSESDPSNDASMPQPPLITRVTLKGAAKIVIVGSRFTSGTLVLADGIPFVAPAKVKRGVTIKQKGPLLTQQTIRQYLASRPPGPSGRRQVLIGVRNNLGAVTTFVLEE